jgi:hypothetical protein
LLGIPVLVATIDLGRAWQDIEVELHSLVDECAGAAGAKQSLQQAATASAPSLVVAQ